MNVLKNLIFLFALLPFGLSAYDEPCPIYFPKQDVCAEVNWVLGPYLNHGHRRHHMATHKKYSTLDVHFWDRNDSSKTPLQFDSIKVYPWMIMHGMEHGARPVSLSLLPNGHYRVSKILFMKMNHGYWEMRFALGNQNFDPKLDYDVKVRVHFTN